MENKYIVCSSESEEGLDTIIEEYLSQNFTPGSRSVAGAMVDDVLINKIYTQVMYYPEGYVFEEEEVFGVGFERNI